MLSVAAWLMLGSMLYALRLDHPGSFPKPLRAAEEREYLLRARAGDREARNILIERNLRLVAHIVKKYYAQNVDQEDLISIGTVGLIKAIASFDPDKGVRLATYAARCVENEILMYFRAQKKTASDVSLSDYLETGKWYQNVDDPLSMAVAPLLSYSTSSTTAVNSVTDGKQVKYRTYYNLAGMASSKPFDGVNIVITNYSDGTHSASKVIK